MEDGAIDLFGLAQKMGFVQLGIDVDDSNFEACLITNIALPFPLILVNSRNSFGRQRFSIAHELAHAILPRHSEHFFVCSLQDITEIPMFKMKNRLEKEANEFAEELILPKIAFKGRIDRLDFSIKNIIALSTYYQVSLILAAIKWVKLSDLQIAITVSYSDGRIDWWWRSEGFPYDYYDIKSNIGSQSPVHCIRGSGDIIRRQVSSDSWFQEDNSRYSLWEETKQWYEEKYLTLLQIGDES
jgi:Zn-dependent peptidase ImmA (M78 family)